MESDSDKYNDYRVNPIDLASLHERSESLKDKIKSLSVSDEWKERFYLMDIAGPRLNGKYENIDNLNKQEIKKISFNIWAFLFTFLYYFAKGMHHKGIFIFAASIIWSSTFHLVNNLFGGSANYGLIIWIPVSLACSKLANSDYFNKLIYDEDMWPKFKFFSNSFALLVLIIFSLTFSYGTIFFY